MTVDVVIGAASGMGAAVARRRAGQGGPLLLADLDVTGAERLAGELSGAHGGDVVVQRCDVTDAGDLDALAGAAKGLGDLGALVVTAGLSPTMGPGRRIYEVDIVAPARLLDTFEPLAGPATAAVVFASMAGHFLPGQAEIDAVLDNPLAPGFFDDLVAAGVDVDEPAMAYTYSKRAVMRLVRRAAAAWGQHGARVVSLSPGIIDTPMGRREYDAQPMMADMVAGSPLGREITPDEIAAVVEFLLSPGATAITGTDVLVDGGVVARLMS